MVLGTDVPANWGALGSAADRSPGAIGTGRPPEPRTGAPVEVRAGGVVVAGWVGAVVCPVAGGVVLGGGVGGALVVGGGLTVVVGGHRIPSVHPALAVAPAGETPTQSTAVLASAPLATASPTSRRKRNVNIGTVTLPWEV